MKEERPNLWSIQVEAGSAVKYGALAVGCGLGIQALARVGACRFNLFDAGELFVCIGSVLLLRPPYQLWAVSWILGAAGIAGIARTANVVLHSLVAGEGLPSVSGSYLLRATVYGSYLLGYWYLNQLAAEAPG
jgi:hypothetical protein